MIGVFVVASWLGCAPSVIGDYERARDAALVDPGPPPAGWQPDAVLAISGAEAEELAGAVIEARSGEPWERRVLGVTTTLTPALTLDELKARPSKACEDCVAIDARLSGKVRYEVLGLGGAIPVRVDAAFDLRFAVDKDADSFVLTATPGKIRRLEVALGDRPARLSEGLTTAIEDGIREQVLGAGATEVGRFGDATTPLRAARVRAHGDDLHVDLLTTAPSPRPVSGADVDVATGIRAWVDQGSLAALARAASFRAGPRAHDVVVEPTALAVDGDAFDLGLRLWKTSGRGWWRDYRVTGTIAVAGRSKALKLSPTAVVEGEKSKGAGLADPLAALAEGLIVSTIEDVVQTTLPVGQRERVGKLGATLTVTGVRGASGALIVDGDLALSKPGTRGDVEKPPARPRAGSRTGR